MEAFHEGPDMLYINPENCIDCNACVEECPVEAIYADVDVPEKWENYTQLNEKKCDLIVYNNINNSNKVFGSNYNKITLIFLFRHLIVL